MWFSRKQREQFKELDANYSLIVSENIELREEIDRLNAECHNLSEKEKDVENVYQEIRRLKHDMRNHLMVISAYLNEEKYDEARDYTSSFLNKIELDFSYIFSGNALLNYILNEKFNVAKSKGIYVKANIENIKFSTVSRIDFAAILTNLLDNAIEAANKSIEKLINVQVKKKAGYDTIKISNSIYKSVLLENPSLLTSKEQANEHGFGLVQVKELISKYEGLFDIWEEDGMFHVQIMIENQE